MSDSDTPTTDGPFQALALSSVPSIQLNILTDHVPDRIASGLRHIANHHIRPHAIRLSTDGLVPAGGTPTLVGTNPHRSVWWWNVAFLEDSSIGIKTWSTATSSDNFAPTSDQNEASSTGFVSTPFLITVRYHPQRPSNAFRALGHILAVTRSIGSPEPTSTGSTSELHLNLFARAAVGNSSWHLSPTLAHQRLNQTEHSNFETVGTMIDCSRNGVLNVASVKLLCRNLACMGYNMLQLYTEDTYEIPDEPFFGYMRGGYTAADLTEIDDYAYDLGIEVIPCIQTLGHLGQMLQWPRFLSLRDTAEVLLAEWPETYIMLEKMIRAATAPFRSDKIHLGMDETHGLGHGRYFSIFGHQNHKDGSRIFVEHLQRVEGICQRLGLRPMIWSDMLFCLSSRNNSLVGYYDSAKPAQVNVQGIPAGVDLVYWDYYHSSEDSYASRIKSHRELRGESPWMAAGSWTWSRFWTALPFTFLTCRANLNASKTEGSGVDHVFLTIWGDEGNEVDLWSSMPSWAYYAEHAFNKEEEVDVTMLKAKFDAVVGGDFDDFVLASKLDEYTADGAQTAVDDRIHFAPNTSKWMLWSDPVCSFVEPSLSAAGIDLSEHYTWLVEMLSDRLEGTVTDQFVTDDNGNATTPPSSAMDEGTEVPSHRASVAISRTLADHPFNARLELARLLARTLALKAGLQQNLHNAYASQDWDRLDRLKDRTRRCRNAARQLWNYHRQMWMGLYKPFGWETLELRYGGLVSRLDTLYRRLDAFLQHVKQGGEPGVPLNGESDVMLEVSSADADNDEPEEWKEKVNSLPELEKELRVVYGSPDQLLDYHRVSRPTYC